jgi:hypothetical protein
MAKENGHSGSFPLRMSPTMRRQATDFAQRERLSLNNFICLALAEKISRMEHELWLRQLGVLDSAFEGNGIVNRPKN